MNLSRWCCGFVFAIVLASIATAEQRLNSDPVMTAMQQELSRSFQNLKQTKVPPYFLSYQLTDNRAQQISASFGALTGSVEHASRVLDIDLRIGDYKLDNTHPLREGTPFRDMADQFWGQRIPLDDDGDALRVTFWRETERKYRQALQRFEQVKANVQVKVEQEDRSADSLQSPPRFILKPRRQCTLTRQAGNKRCAGTRAVSRNTRRLLRAVWRLSPKSRLAVT